MKAKIFVNLAVNDLEASKLFFKQLGFSFNQQFTNEEAACLEINEDGYVMLLSPAKFKQFTNKAIADARTTCQVMIALSAESRDQVDQLLSKAIERGGKETREVQDYGFMYGRAFEDIDGNIWESIWMDPSIINAANN